MQINRLLDNRQAKPGSRHIVHVRASLKRRKQALLIGFGDSNAVILYRKSNVIVTIQSYAHITSLRRVFDGIRNQIRGDGTQQSGSTSTKFGK